MVNPMPYEFTSTEWLKIERFICDTCLLKHMAQFSDLEASIITNHALTLMENGYFSGINRIQFPFEKRKQIAYFIFHYLQDSIKQINFIKSKLPSNIKYAKAVKREKYYLFDPAYITKPEFLEEYKSADFRHKNLQKISIEEVIANPKNVIVANEEIDFIIETEDNEQSIRELAEFVYRLDREGPERWIHPAMIVRGEKKMHKIPNFKHKTFVAIRKNDDLFYAIMFDKQRLMAIKEYIARECKNIRTISGVKINFGMVIYTPCQINKEFDVFMKHNIYEFKPLF